MTRQEIWWNAYFAALRGVSDSKAFDPEFCVSFADRCADLTIDRFTSESGYIYSPPEKAAGDRGDDESK